MHEVKVSRLVTKVVQRVTVVAGSMARYGKPSGIWVLDFDVGVEPNGRHPQSNDNASKVKVPCSSREHVRQSV